MSPHAFSVRHERGMTCASLAVGTSRCDVPHASSVRDERGMTRASLAVRTSRCDVPARLRGRSLSHLDRTPRVSLPNHLLRAADTPARRRPAFSVRNERGMTCASPAVGTSRCDVPARVIAGGTSACGIRGHPARVATALTARGTRDSWQRPRTSLLAAAPVNGLRCVIPQSDQRADGQCIRIKTRFFPS